ncbi:MAG: Rrf2 family transcriptional regulator [Candidatus Latescibacteria bacterium]|jgi:Rrf2 family protein|nr:Rrf2 family transcriptional regulator [Candidatus Latescibacterota bacterium]
MKLSTQEEYGLRCLIQIAQNERNTGNSITISEISNAEGLSTANVGKLVRLLRLGNFIESVRGQAGGYKLARQASEVSIADVLTALGGRLFDPEFCGDHAGQEELCTHTVNCSVRSLWNAIQFVVDQMLDKITLHDLLGDENALQSELREKAQQILQVAPAP